MTFLTRTRT